MRFIIALLISTNCISQTIADVKKELVEQDVYYPQIVLAQSILETGWYKCKNCSLDENNIFGLWHHKKQEYYHYNTWQESIGGYKRGIQYKFFRKDYKDYYEFLKDIGYATDPEYINKLKKIVKKTNYVWSK